MLPSARLTALRATLAAVCLALIVPGAALAAGSLSTTTNSSYKLLPGQETIKVNVDVTLNNRKAPTARIQACPSNPALRCRVTTNYYYNGWGNLYVPAGATKLKIISPNVRASVQERTKHWTVYKVSFPNLNYRQTRKIKASYELPGGKPRSKHRTRVMDAYTYFCWHGEPGDRGKVTVELPPGYEATTFGEKTRTRSNKKGTTITARAKGNPAKFYACTDAFKPSKLMRTEMTSPGGQQVIVEGWPEDPEWSAGIAEAVEDSLPELEELIGRPMPLEEVTLREVSKQSLYGYGSEFGVRRALVRLGEHIDNPVTAPRALASTWFNDRKIADDWLNFGLTSWAGMEVGAFGCWPASDYPGKGKPRLGQWKQLKEKPSERLEALVDWQYDAACNIIGEVADEVGEERMQAVIASLLDGTPKYGPQPAESRGKFRKATWKDWLDAADELGLVPAGVTDLSVAEQGLKDVGVATGKQLKGRADARAAYHEALAQMDGTHLPRLVNEAMGKWDFKAAMKALPMATDTYAAIMANESMADPDREMFLEGFTEARSPKALRTLKEQATGFVAADIQPTDPTPAPTEPEAEIESA